VSDRLASWMKWAALRSGSRRPPWPGSRARWRGPSGPPGPGRAARRRPAGRPARRCGRASRPRRPSSSRRPGPGWGCRPATAGSGCGTPPRLGQSTFHRSSKAVHRRYRSCSERAARRSPRATVDSRSGWRGSSRTHGRAGWPARSWLPQGNHAVFVRSSSAADRVHLDLGPERWVSPAAHQAPPTPAASDLAEGFRQPGRSAWAKDRGRRLFAPDPTPAGASWPITPHQACSRELRFQA
jgi:hypothetical protein